jgi:hypothetical protein
MAAFSLSAIVVGAWAEPSQAQYRPKPSCPLLVPANEEFVQPKRIQPDQVKAKNAMGCLSPADAVYGADGCPLKLCGPDAGVIQLPEP